MIRKRKRRGPSFRCEKMLSARVEDSDHRKFEFAIRQHNKSIQEVLNSFIVSIISGSLEITQDGFMAVKK